MDWIGQSTSPTSGLDRPVYQPTQWTEANVAHLSYISVDTPTCDVIRGRYSKRLVTANHTHTWYEYEYEYGLESPRQTSHRVSLPSTSWQTPRSPLLRARGGDRRDGGRGEEEAEEEERRKRRNVPTVWVSAAAGGTNDGEEEEEEEDEELNTLRVQSWGQPRRSVMTTARGR